MEDSIATLRCFSAAWARRWAALGFVLALFVALFGEPHLPLRWLLVVMTATAAAAGWLGGLLFALLSLRTDFHKPGTAASSVLLGAACGAAAGLLVLRFFGWEDVLFWGTVAGALCGRSMALLRRCGQL